MSDVSAFITRFQPGIAAQLIFPCRQRTYHTQKAFRSDEPNQHQVSGAKSEVPHELPVPEMPEPNQWQRANIEEDNQRMKNQNKIGKKRTHRALRSHGISGERELFHSFPVD